MSRWVSSRSNEIEEHRFNMVHDASGKFGESTGEALPKTGKFSTMADVAKAHPEFTISKTGHGFQALHGETGRRVEARTTEKLHDNILKLLSDLAFEAAAKFIVEGLAGAGGG